MWRPGRITPRPTLQATEHMLLSVTATIAFTAIIQSMFGVGVLLFGTPTLLLLGFGFADALQTLLPVSLAINLLQIASEPDKVDRDVLRSLAIYSLPAIAVTLWLTLRISLPIDPVVGVVIVFIASGEVWSLSERLMKAATRRRSAFMVVMGLVHGLTNLGGSLLTAFVYGAGHEKEESRPTIAAGYAIFAVVQLATLIASGASQRLVSLETAGNIAVGVTVFGVVEHFFYRKTTATVYRRMLSLLLLATGVMILARSV